VTVTSQVTVTCDAVESREPGSPGPALFSQGGEEDEMSPYKVKFIIKPQTLLDGYPTFVR